MTPPMWGGLGSSIPQIPPGRSGVRSSQPLSLVGRKGYPALQEAQIQKRPDKVPGQLWANLKSTPAVTRRWQITAPLSDISVKMRQFVLRYIQINLLLQLCQIAAIGHDDVIEERKGTADGNHSTTTNR